MRLSHKSKGTRGVRDTPCAWRLLASTELLSQWRRDSVYWNNIHSHSSFRWTPHPGWHGGHSWMFWPIHPSTADTRV